MIIHGDSLNELKTLADDSIDFVCTDPPYGYSFMGKDWDKAVPSVDIWRECLRVLKPAAFMCVMSAPRSDVQAQMIVRLTEAGFRLDFTPIYWTYASGFPKAGNIGKLVDKRLGVEDLREFSHKNPADRPYTHSKGETSTGRQSPPRPDKTHPYSDQAKALDGSYAGFQPKPAVEVIIVAMKPLSEKTYVDQALANGHGISWLDDGRIPYEPADKEERTARTGTMTEQPYGHNGTVQYSNGMVAPVNPSGRFPANLLVSDDVLNDGVERKARQGVRKSTSDAGHSLTFNHGADEVRSDFGDSGSYSRYFDLDKWAQTLPFLITPKASKSEKNKGLDGFADRQAAGLPMRSANGERGGTGGDGSKTDRLTTMKNHHPTVKPQKLMSYLITLFSRAGDVVLDPFCGSGSTNVAAHNLGRETIGIEREAEYVEIARARLAHVKPEITQLPPEEPKAAEPPVTIKDIVSEQLNLL